MIVQQQPDRDNKDEEKGMREMRFENCALYSHDEYLSQRPAGFVGRSVVSPVSFWWFRHITQLGNRPIGFLR